MKRILFLMMMLVCPGMVVEAQTIRNSNNSTLATVGSDGTIRNSSNSVIARISSNGDIRDSNNHTIGYAQGVPIKYAAVYFFFNLLPR